MYVSGGSFPPPISVPRVPECTELSQSVPSLAQRVIDASLEALCFVNLWTRSWWQQFPLSASAQSETKTLISGHPDFFLREGLIL